MPEYREQQDGDLLITGSLTVLGGINDTDISEVQAVAQTTNSVSEVLDVDMTSVLTDLSELESDSKLTPSEKLVVKREWTNISQEYAAVLTQASTHGITAGDTAYDNYVTAYDALDAYLNTNPTGVIYDLTTTTDITGGTLRTNFATYWQRKSELIDAIEDITATYQDIVDGFTEPSGGAPDPPNVGSISATAYPRKIVVEWSPVGGPNGPYIYDLQRSTNGGSTWANLQTDYASTKYEDSIGEVEYSAISGANGYWYRVWAQDRFGNNSVSWTATVADPTRDASYGTWAVADVADAAIRASGVNRSLALFVQPQGYDTQNDTTDDLIDAVGIRVRISNDDSNWYEPNFDTGTTKGTDADRWKVDPGAGYVDTGGYVMQMHNLPLTNETASTIAVTSETYYVQVKYVQQDGSVSSNWSSSVSVTLEPTGARDVVQNAIKARNMDPDALDAVEDALVLHLPMDQIYADGGSYYTADVSGNVNLGTATSMTSANEVAGISGNALDFDGSADYITVTDDATLQFGTGDFAISLWVKFDNAAAAAAEDLIDKRDSASYEGILVYRNTDEKIYFLTPNVIGSSWHEVVSDSAITDTASFHHIVCQRTSGVMEMWVDGVKQADTQAATTSVSDGTYNIRIAASVAAGDKLDGKIDEIRFYSTALTEAQIKFLYMIPSGAYGKLIDNVRIKHGEITADKMNVTELSAITANIGTITNGGLQYDVNYNFWDLDTGEFRVGNATVYMHFDPSGGGSLTFAGDVLQVSSTSATIDGTLDVTGATTLSSTLDVTGTVTLATASNGKVNIGTSDTPEATLHLQTAATTPVNMMILERQVNVADTEIGILFKDRTAIAGGQEAARIWVDRQSSTGNFDVVIQGGDQGAAGLQPIESIRVVGDTGGVDLAADTNVEINAARTALHSTSLADYAFLSHYDLRTSGTSYAVLQNSAGQTSLNASSGQAVLHQIAGTTLMRLNVTGLNVGSSADATNPLSVIGAANVTGSFTVGAADLVVDTDTLYVDAAADMVGINTPSPDKELDVLGSIIGRYGATAATSWLFISGGTQAHVAANAYYDSGWKSIGYDATSLHSAAVIQTGIHGTTEKALMAAVDLSVTAADQALTMDYVFAVEADGIITTSGNALKLNYDIENDAFETNADASIYFASDAYLLWDESESELTAAIPASGGFRVSQNAAVARAEVDLQSTTSGTWTNTNISLYNFFACHIYLRYSNLSTGEESSIYYAIRTGSSAWTVTAVATSSTPPVAQVSSGTLQVRQSSGGAADIHVAAVGVE